MFSNLVHVSTTTFCHFFWFLDQKVLTSASQKQIPYYFFVLYHKINIFYLNLQITKIQSLKDKKIAKVRKNYKQSHCCKQFHWCLATIAYFKTFFVIIVDETFSLSHDLNVQHICLFCLCGVIVRENGIFHVRMVFM